MAHELVVKAGGKAVAFLVDRIRQSLARKQRDWVEDSLREAAQVAHAAAVAWLALALGRQPLEHEVQAYLKEGTDDPSFPARLHRLFGELLNSPSRTRRQRLAAVLFAGPKALPDTDNLDRLDILASALLDADVSALEAVERGLKQTATTPFQEDRKVVFRGVGERGVLTLGQTMEVWSVTYKGPPQDVAAVSRLSLLALESAGCLSISPPQQVRGHTQPDGQDGPTIHFNGLTLSALGAFFLESLRKEPIQSAVAR